ncbi:hypothetical protein J2X70_004103, partial [Stenotrophomonas sp. 1337]|nr:hypothetical protein [Stenotrophomonas sp. 1337]
CGGRCKYVPVSSVAPSMALTPPQPDPPRLRQIFAICRNGVLCCCWWAARERHGVRSVSRRKTDLTPELFRYLTDIHPRMAWIYCRSRKSVGGGAVSDCGVSAAWARGMPRAGWAGRPTPVLPCAQESAHEQAAAKPTGTYLRRPRNPTPPRHPTECQLASAVAVASASAGAGRSLAEPSTPLLLLPGAARAWCRATARRSAST